MYFPTQSEKSKTSQSDGDNRNIIRIRSLCISPVNADMEDAIKGYFTQFGAVEFVEVHKKNDTHCGLVQFEMAEAAAFALSNVTHRIANCDVTVKPADPSEQPDFILNALDDDCLREVFRYLGPKDLSNTADVCQRFNKQAKVVFSSKYSTLEITDYSTFVGGLKDIENVLRNFGSSIQSLEILAPEWRTEYNILRLIAQHCTSKLKELSLRGFLSRGNSIDENMSQNTFNKLEKLELFYCSMGNNLKVLFGGCVELKSLYFYSCDFYSECIERTLGKLEEARFCSVSWLSEDSFLRFIALNPTLMKLSYWENVEKYSENVIRCIVQNLPNLVKLEIDVTRMGLNRMLSYATKLSQLYLLGGNFDIKIDLKEYKTLLAIVQNRPEKIHLLIDIYDHMRHVYVPETTLEKNRDCIFITELYAKRLGKF